MVARSPRRQQRDMAVAVAPPPPLPLSPTLLRDTVKKVDKCMARLQELQNTVAGGRKVVSGVSQLSPGSTRSYSRTSVRCKQESLRNRNAHARRSPPGKLPTNKEEWQRMSLPAMLLGETMGEILQATQFARNIVEAVSSNKTRKPTAEDPRTPLTERRKQNLTLERSQLHARRRREKQVVQQTIRSESDMPSLQRAKSRINFKTSPLQKKNYDKENCRYIANRVSPSNRPWARKTVLFPNPLFHSSPTSPHPKFPETKSPVNKRNRPTPPHKFLIKAPPASKFQVKINNHPLSISPTTSLVKKSPKASTAAKLRRSFSPSRLANRFVYPLKNTNYVQKNEGALSAAKLRKSFSPSRLRLANRLVSPLKSRKSVQIGAMNITSGLKQRPMSMSVQFSPRRI